MRIGPRHRGVKSLIQENNVRRVESDHVATLKESQTPDSVQNRYQAILWLGRFQCLNNIVLDHPIL